MVDPILKRIMVDPIQPMPPAWARVTFAFGFVGFLGAVLWSKHVSPKEMERRIARDMYASVPEHH